MQSHRRRLWQPPRLEGKPTAARSSGGTPPVHCWFRPYLKSSRALNLLRNSTGPYSIWSHSRSARDVLWRILDGAEGKGAKQQMMKQDPHSNRPVPSSDSKLSARAQSRSPKLISVRSCLVRFGCYSAPRRLIQKCRLPWDPLDQRRLMMGGQAWVSEAASFSHQ